MAVADHVPFNALAGLLEKVENKSQRLDGARRKGEIQKFIQKWREAHASLHKDGKKTVSIKKNISLHCVHACECL